jgi:hypothetical protein
MTNAQMKAEGFKKVTTRYYLVDRNPSHKVWGKNKKEIYKNNPQLKGRCLLFVEQETKWVPA